MDGILMFLVLAVTALAVGFAAAWVGEWIVNRLGVAAGWLVIVALVAVSVAVLAVFG